MDTCPSCGFILEPKTKRAKKKTDPEVINIVRFYIDSFTLKFGAPPSVKWGACGTLAKRLMKDYTYSDIVFGIINEYLNCDDKFFKEAGYPFLLLPNYIQKRAVLNKKTDTTPSWKRGAV